MGEWSKLEEIFHGAADLSGTERERYLQTQCAGNTGLRVQVEELLRHDEECESRLGRLVGDVAERAAAAQPKRAGPYRILKEIGQGGMGSVFLAERDDQHYRQQVALKLVRTGMNFAGVLDKFRHERQILANLQHDHIARLLDGGATDEGLPFLAMEFIDGQTIRDYVREKGLTARQVAELFVPVCDAVAYAHRNLVVHRDIKPGNILVSREGVPKLVDFGIAKLLEGAGDSAAETRPWMTPEYASPEQKAGAPVTTATDVYSLGAVLFELLAGRRLKSDGELERGVISPADLETVVLTAVHPDPGQRYQSADALRADLEHFLQDRPILARGDSFGYRWKKFVQRNRVAVGAAALVALSVIGGLAATLWQARKAAAEGERAARRFNEVRSLARTFLFEFHDQVLELPNSTRVREAIVQRSLEYLNRLSQDAPGDVALQRELAAAYERVGDLMDSPQRQNLGKTKEAREAWGKAVEVMAKLEQEKLASYDDLLTLARNQCHLGRSLMVRDQQPTKALEWIERCRATANEAALKKGFGAQVMLSTQIYPGQMLMDAYARLGRIPEALTEGRRIEQVGRAALAEKDTEQALFGLAGTLTRMGLLYSRGKEPEAMIRAHREAIAIHRQLDAKAEKAMYRRALFVALQMFVDKALNAEEMGLTIPPLESGAREQMALAEQLRQSDPANAQAEFDYANAAFTLGRYLIKTKPQEALKLFTEASTIFAKRLKASPGRLAEIILNRDLESYTEKARERAMVRGR